MSPALSARQIAEQAAYEADAPKRAEQEQREREKQQQQQQLAQQCEQFVRRARARIEELLPGVDTSTWEVVVSRPSYAVLRDPADEPYLTNSKLTLLVSAHYSEDSRELTVMYAPYEGYGESRRSRFSRTGHWGGPVITDALSLGRALKAHDQEVLEHHRSMVAYPP